MKDSLPPEPERQMMESQSQINDGGPAFPRTGSKTIEGYGVDEQDGMSLRDHFAGQALNGLISSDRVEELEDRLMHRNDYPAYCLHMATAAYQYADAMIAARSGS